MGASVEGVYRDGRIDLAEPLVDVPNETAVVVTVSASGGVDLRSLGIQADQAAEIRARLASFAEEWESPEMDVYDNYDAALAQRSAR